MTCYLALAIPTSSILLRRSRETPRYCPARFQLMPKFFFRYKRTVKEISRDSIVKSQVAKRTSIVYTYIFKVNCFEN